MRSLMPLLVVALLAFPATAGAKEDEAGLRVLVGSDSIVFELEEERAGHETEAKVTFDGSQAAIVAEVERENATAETEFELKVLLGELVEYRDADGDGRHGAGDEAVQRVPLKGLAWQATGPVAAKVDGVDVQRATAHAPLGGEGSIALVFAASGERFRAGASEVRPDAVKFDIHIGGFPWRAEGTRLALTATVHEERESEGQDDDDGRGEDRVEARGRDYTATFRWATNATVDGRDVPVAASIEELAPGDDDDGERTSRVTLNYPRGSSILHDPVIGIAAAQRGLPAAGAPLAMAVVALAALAWAGPRRPRAG